MTINVKESVELVYAKLAQLGFTPRDADGSDFQRGEDQSLRFKVGSSHGEVAVQVWRGKHPAGVLRAISSLSLDSTLQTIEGMADDQVGREA